MAKFIQTAEGRVTKSGSVWTYEYNLKDHLGNVRVSFRKSATGTAELLQKDDYYPFGLTFNSYSNSPENLYKFQGQEEQKETGWVQFKWRNHDPTIGRFFNVDPLAEDYVHNSPYAFSENKVTAHIELEGLEAVSIKNQDIIPYADPENYQPGNNIVPKRTYTEKRTTNTTTVSKFDGKSNNPEVSIRRDYNIEGGKKIPSQIATLDSKGNEVNVAISFLNTSSDNKSSNNAINSTAVEGLIGTLKTANGMDAAITSIAVSATTNGSHSGGWENGNSNHYKGTALDIGLINGHIPGVADSTFQKAADLQPKINENFGPYFDHKGAINISNQNHSSWIHLSFE